MTEFKYDMNARRWYDRDPVLSKAMKILETSDDKLQIQVAINLIKVIMEHHIEENEYSSVDDMIKAVENGKLNKGSARWYDIDHTLRTAIQMLENCSLEMQSKVAREIATLVKEQFCDEDEDEGLDI
ncbi:MAG: hypothetical protein PHC34_03830 [Candidatus Gastranaerophilales bacterium]|nr:hypothetical protein [Candidatus Gastranaerophilales bacterium]